jgi:hypothetical protein
MDSPTVLLAISCPAVFGSVVWVATQIEDAANKQFKDDVKDWLSNKKDSTASKVFTGVFDCVFGRNLKTVRSFGRSASFSIAALFLVFVTWVLLRPKEFQAAEDTWQNNSFKEIAGYWVFPTVLYVLAVYVSLFLARRVLNVNTENGLFGNLALFGITVAMVFVIGILCIVLIVIIGQKAGLSIDLGYFVDNFWLGFQLKSDQSNPPLGIWLYAGLAPSAWALLHICAGAILKLMPWARKILDVENRPIKSFGVVFATLAFTCIAMLKFFVILFDSGVF